MIVPKSSYEELIASEAVTDTASAILKTTGGVLNAVGSVGKAAMSVKGTIGKSSITRMGKDSILEFPCVFSANVDVDDSIAITKMLERNYASLLVSIFSLRPAVALNEYSDIAEYIKSIHNNSGIPTNLKKAQHFARESMLTLEEDFCLDDEDEGSPLGVNALLYDSKDMNLGMECWGIHGGCLDEENLNDLVRPYNRSIGLIEQRLEDATKVATEGIVDHFKNKKGKAPVQVPQSAADKLIDNIQKRANPVIVAGKNSSNLISDGKNRPPSAYGRNSATQINHNMIMQAPTMIDVTFYIHGSKAGGSDAPANFAQNVTLGIKGMTRQVSNEYMITNLIEGSKSSNPIFKLISWTRGEYKFVKDFLFNIGEVKKHFKNKKTDAYGIFEISKNRKEIDDVSKFAANRVLPYLSVIATEYEVAQAAQATGVDLTNYRNAKAFMEKYYLLAFGIYSADTKTLKILFDGGADWETMSMTYIQTSQKKEMDVTRNMANLISMR